MITNSSSLGTIYRYCIDSRDIITEVSDNWNAFALENAAPQSCSSPQVLGTVLWDHFQDRETRHIYQALVARVRTTKRSVSVPICCDSPDMKRFIEMRIAPLENGALEFISRIVRLEPRPPVALLDKSHSRSDDLIRICSFCKQIDLGGDQWVDTEAAIIRLGLFGKPVLPGLTHTICPSCMDAREADDQ